MGSGLLERRISAPGGDGAERVGGGNLRCPGAPRPAAVVPLPAEPGEPEAVVGATEGLVAPGGVVEVGGEAEGVTGVAVFVGVVEGVVVLMGVVG